jgi:hypothetical protein
MLFESRVRSKGLLRAGVQLLMVSAFTLFLLDAAGSSDIAGTWKADLSKTSPPDNNELAVTLTIREIGPRTYTIGLQTTDRRGGSEEMTVTCDVRSRPLSGADSGAGGGKVFCGLAYPISIRVTQNDGTLIEHVFWASSDGNSLKYTKTVAGHDRTYVSSRQ